MPPRCHAASLRAGTLAPSTFTFRYAAPETIAALEQQTSSIIATEAVDAWALGVMAWELITGEPCFPDSQSNGEVRPPHRSSARS